MVHSVDKNSVDPYQLVSYEASCFGATLFLKRFQNFKKVMHTGLFLDQIQLLAWLPHKVYYFVFI